jgi:hypothetical protein
MRIRPGLAVMLASLALPSTALAQSGGAGDNQYSDPFANQAPTATPTPKPAATATPGPASTAASATATPAPAAAAPAAAPAPQLPYTGLDAWPLALGGALALGAGVTLRSRLRDDD